VLRELVVENYAVVERVRVRFHPGFNLLTGETGSGKSIVVDALGLLFGGRASTGMIRSGAEWARISGIFDAPGALPDGIEADNGELLIEREILANGKSRAFCNSRPVSVTLLRDLAPSLGDIHGQHEQQRLFEEAAQRGILDAAGGIDLAETAASHREWTSAAAELEQIEQSERERLRQQDLWSFQRNEIESASLHPGEDEDLEAEKRRLGNVTRLSQSAAEAYAALYDSPDSSLATLRTAIKRCEELVRIDGTLAEPLESMKSAELSLREAAHAIAGYSDRLEADPARLEWVESRLALFDKLKRKYGGTLAEVIAYGDEVARSLEQLRESGVRRETLEKQAAAGRKHYEKAAAAVTAQRGKAARRLETDLAAALKPLAMDRARIVIRIEPGPPSSTGSDRVEFLISPNAGEEPRPLDKVLSGGELSRLALALKTITDTGAPGRTLVFDEVDAGIGGAVAEAVGRRLKQVSAANLVLCVTHLAQIAGFGDHHYAVEKREVRGRTVAMVEELTREQRIRELGRMLAGQRLTPEALKHAEQLLSE
jgi:DNA repair protein RecN (Recombination protein N)